MALPVGSRTFPPAPLPQPPTTTGTLPLGQRVPAPLVQDSTGTVTAPAGPGGQTVLLDGQGQRVLPYTATVDGRTTPGQMGPYATLVPQVDNSTVVSVTLPPEVAQFLAITPSLESALALLDALLARMETWSLGGAQTCGAICQALALLVAGYQAQTTASSSLSAPVHIFLVTLKRQFADSARLFLARAQEATGTASPLVQASAQNALTALQALASNGVVGVPSGNLGVRMDTITQGVLLP